MTNTFTARIELNQPAIDLTDDQIDDMMTTLAAHHGVLGASALGRIEITMTVEDPQLLTALTSAAQIAAQATGLEVTAIAGAQSDEFDDASRFQPIPTLRTVVGAAKSAGVVPQTIHNAIRDNKLKYTLADGKRLIPQSSLNAYIATLDQRGKEPMP
jgi:hypothetical protein